MRTTTPKNALVDRRARMIVNSYCRKFKTLDVTFAADMVGDGKGGIKSPFETAQQEFLSRTRDTNVHSVVW